MTGSPEPTDLAAALLRPEAYPWRPQTVELIETHISWVFLAGERVVKVKRPVHFGFVDHTKLESRRHSCVEEVRLNRRLTEGVYLGVVPIARENGRFVVDGSGAPVEWATLMRRLPAERMLDALLAAGELPPDSADRLADRLIAFHRDAATPCASERYGSVEALAAVTTDNLAEFSPFAGSILPAGQFAMVDRAMRRFIATNSDLLARRVTAGWVRDGHGDLRAEHVCLEPNGAVQIFDCVEFSPALRCADVASDLAFLLMDLDRLGAGAMAQTLERRYRQGGLDLPEPLLRVYRAHRALVRAKVACLTPPSALGRHTDPAGDALPYLHAATRALFAPPPLLVAMTGLSGTGKSTVARALAQALGADLVSSDGVRKELAGVTGPAPAAWQEGLYGAEWTERTYARLFERAAAALAAGRPIVLDATFLDADRRQQAARVAADAGAPLIVVETVCDEAVVAERIGRRQARGDAASDASLAIHQRQRAALQADPPPIPDGAIGVRVDTTARLSIDPVLRALDEAGLLRSLLG